jgi:hopanoid biosynthesis associated protein HpnK
MPNLRGLPWNSIAGLAPAPDRRLIINADDFGLSSAVNVAVERAYHEGVLRSASLMTGEAAAGEAVDIARRNLGLSVGLHVTLTDGFPVLDPSKIPDLIQSSGRFHDDETKLNGLLITSRSVRHQVRAEVVAQFAAIRAAGLVCDHVNAHRNFHLHPIIAAIIIKVARREGVRAIRVPWQPTLGGINWHSRSSAPISVVRCARVAFLRRLVRQHGMVASDRSIDITGRGAYLERLLRILPFGTTEFYSHPAITNIFPGSVAGFPYEADLAALLDPDVRNASAALAIGGYQTMLQ